MFSRIKLFGIVPLIILSLILAFAAGVRQADPPDDTSQATWSASDEALQARRTDRSDGLILQAEITTASSKAKGKGKTQPAPSATTSASTTNPDTSAANPDTSVTPGDSSIMNDPAGEEPQPDPTPTRGITETIEPEPTETLSSTEPAGTVAPTSAGTGAPDPTQATTTRPASPTPTTAATTATTQPSLPSPSPAPTVTPAPEPSVTPVVSEAGVIYVSPSGSDSNSGSAAAPYRTIRQAISRAAPDSIIEVAAGTYNEKLVLSGKRGLILRNRSGDRPVISGAGFSSGYLINITSSQDIKITGFEICDFAGKYIEGIMIRNASQRVEISSCVIHDIKTTLASGNAHVILASGDSSTPLTGIVIKDNHIYNCVTGWSESVTMEGNVDGFAITGNRIHDVTNIAIDATGFYDSGCTVASMNQARNGLIARNTVYNIRCAYAACAGIYVDGGRDIIIERNIVYNSMFGIEVGCENPVDAYNPSVKARVSGVTVRYNTVYNNTEMGISIGGYNGTQTGQVVNCQIYNNTVYNNACELTLGYCDQISLTRNIFYSGPNGCLIYNDPVNSVTQLQMDDNVYFAATGTGGFTLSGKYVEGLAKWRTMSGQDQSSRFIDPLFADPGKDNFKLMPDSPAVGIGAHGTT